MDNHKAFDPLFTAEHWYPIAMRLACAIIRRKVAHPNARVAAPEDYVQDVLPGFLQNLAAGKIYGEPASYLATMIRNRVVDDLRKPSREMRCSFDNAPAFADLVSTNDEVPRTDFRLDAPIIFQALINRLSGAKAALLKYFFVNRFDFDDPDDREIAAIALGWSPEAFEKTRQRLFKHLRAAEALPGLDAASRSNSKSVCRPEPLLQNTWEYTFDLIRQVAASLGRTQVDLVGREVHCHPVCKLEHVNPTVSRLMDACVHLRIGAAILEVFLTHEELAPNHASVLCSGPLFELVIARTAFNALDRQKFVAVALWFECEAMFQQANLINLGVLPAKEMWTVAEGLLQRAAWGRWILDHEGSSHVDAQYFKHYFHAEVPSRIIISNPAQ